MKIQVSKDYIDLIDVKNFDVAVTFDCGQCFRFVQNEDGSVEGVAHGKVLRLKNTSPTSVRIWCTEDDFNNIWSHYLDLETDYAENEKFFAFDNTLASAYKVASGIRILNQEPWETLCSFIISQNNNIPRIKKIVEALCMTYGEPIETESGTKYAFPRPEVLVGAGEQAIFDLKTGFRAKYIIDAATRVSTGATDLCSLSALPTDKAREALCEIKGVGPKVADCTLLFGFGRGDAFPIDVWVKKILAKYYPDGLDVALLGDKAGIAQQYLFYYERWLGGDNNA